MKRFVRTASARGRRAASVGAAVALACSVGLAASGSAVASTKAKKAKSLTNLSMAYAAPSADQMLLEVGVKAGIFKKYGINANVQFLQSSLLFPSLASGQVQFAVAAGPNPETISLSGTPIEFIGQYENAADVENIGGPKIGNSPASANGKSIAISSAGSLSDFVTHLYEQKYNVKMTEVPLGNLNNDEAAYASGSVEAAAAVSPWQVAPFQQQVPGTHVLEDFRGLKNYVGMGVIANKNYVTKHSALAVNVMKAFIKTLAYWKTHPAPAIAAISQYTSEPTDEATQAYHTVSKLLMPNMVPLLQAQKNTLKALTGFGYPAAATFNPKALFTTTYVLKAYKALHMKP